MCGLLTELVKTDGHVTVATPKGASKGRAPSSDQWRGRGVARVRAVFLLLVPARALGPSSDGYRSRHPFTRAGLLDFYLYELPAAGIQGP